MSEIATLSQAQILALVAENADLVKAALAAHADEQKAEEQRVKAEMAVFGSDFIEHVIASVPLKTTESTGRVGRDVVSMPYTGADGVKRTVSIHVTDSDATEKGRAAVKAKKAADEAAEKDKKEAAALGITA
jgi:hypothetical protein